MRTSADAAWVADTVEQIKRVALANSTFTTDDIWPHVDMPEEPRAMGIAMRAAQEQGICIPSGGYRKSVRPACHRRPVLVWRSRLTA